MQDLIDRIRHRLDVVGLDASPASLAAGLGKDYIRDILRRHKRTISSDAAPKLARVLKCNVEWLVGGAGPETSDNYEQFAEAVPGENPPTLKQTPPLGRLPVTGYVAASSWQDVDDLDQDVREWLPMMPIAEYMGRKQYALKVVGDSMNLIVPDGGYVVVVEEFGLAPRIGDIVVVRLHDRGRVKRTLKTVALLDGTLVLMPESSDPRFKPIPINGGEDTNIEIEAYVIFIVQKARRT